MNSAVKGLTNRARRFLISSPAAAGGRAGRKRKGITNKQRNEGEATLRDAPLAEQLPPSCRSPEQVRPVSQSRVKHDGAIYRQTEGLVSSGCRKRPQRKSPSWILYYECTAPRAGLTLTAAEPWPENAALYQQLKEEQILLSDNASSLAVQAFLQMCNLPIRVVCRANAEYMSPSGKVPFIHVGNQVVSELGPIVQFVKAKGHSLSDGLDEVQKAEMKAYMELVNNMLLTAELYLQWCDDVTVEEITHPRYGSPYPWPLNRILSYQKQWEVRRKMKAIGWAGKTLEQVLEDVDQCCQALSQRLGTQPYFFNKQPTELDALVFGHLFTILTTQLTTDELSEKVKNYSNLTAFCRRIEQQYFEGHDKDSAAAAAARPAKRSLLR
ncbi:metaxin-2 [Egretta garzetta]|nr:metaxin-2 [Egretta garzetta]